MDGHFWPLVDGEWALWRIIGVRAARFPVDGLTGFGTGEAARTVCYEDCPRDHRLEVGPGLRDAL